VIRNTFVDRWQGREAEIPAHRDELRAELESGNERADLAVAGVSAGVAAGLISRTRSAAEIVEDIVAEAEQILRMRPAAILG
jgi:nitronate monooxygenase